MKAKHNKKGKEESQKDLKNYSGITASFLKKDLFPFTLFTFKERPA